MTLDEGISGIALYFEVKSDEVDQFVSQFIVIPKSMGSDGTVLEQRIHTRAVTAKRPQPAWRKFSTDEDTEAQPSERSSGRYIQHNDTQSAVEKGLNQLRSCMTVIDPILFSSYSLVGEPLLVEFSEQDVQDMIEDKTPRGLIGRINRLREAREFPTLPGKEA